MFDWKTSKMTRQFCLKNRCKNGHFSGKISYCEVFILTLISLKLNGRLFCTVVFYLNFDTIPITSRAWEQTRWRFTKCVFKYKFRIRGLDSKCPSKVVVQDFSITAFDFSGTYSQLKPTFNESVKGFYQNEDRPQYCIWWHKPYRHWWIGSCGNRGDNSGFAWLDPPTLCPTHGKNGEWRQSHTDEVIDGTVTEFQDAQESGVKIEVAIEG